MVVSLVNILKYCRNLAAADHSSEFPNILESTMSSIYDGWETSWYTVAISIWEPKVEIWSLREVIYTLVKLLFYDPTLGGICNIHEVQEWPKDYADRELK